MRTFVCSVFTNRKRPSLRRHHQTRRTTANSRNDKKKRGTSESRDPAMHADNKPNGKGMGKSVRAEHCTIQEKSLHKSHTADTLRMCTTVHAAHGGVWPSQSIRKEAKMYYFIDCWREGSLHAHTVPAKMKARSRCGNNENTVHESLLRLRSGQPVQPLQTHNRTQTILSRFFLVYFSLLLLVSYWLRLYRLFGFQYWRFSFLFWNEKKKENILLICRRNTVCIWLWLKVTPAWQQHANATIAIFKE